MRMSPYNRTNLCRACLMAGVLLGGQMTPDVFGQSSSETIESVLPKVVKIFGSGGFRGLQSYSTGFLVSGDGYIVTLWSHVLDAEQVTIVLDDGRRFFAKVAGAEPQLEMAVLKIQEVVTDLPHFDLSQAGKAGPGTRVLAFSNMFKVAAGDEPVSVLHGIVSAQTKMIGRRGVFETPYDGPILIVDAIINNPGAGGGVVVTYDGRLLGMIGKEVRNSQSNTWLNYAVPVSQFEQAVQQIISGNFSSSTAATETDPQAEPRRYSARDFGFLTVPDVLFETPAYVDTLIPGSAAESAGMRPDDLVLFANDQLVRSNRELRRELGRLEADETLVLVVRRGDQLVRFEFPVPRKNSER